MNPEPGYGPWIAPRPITQKVTLKIPVGPWVLPETTKNCAHGGFYKETPISIPTCDSCGVEAILYDPDVHGPIEIPEGFIYSKAVIKERE